MTGDTPEPSDSQTEAELELRRLVAPESFSDEDLEKHRREQLIARSKEDFDRRCVDARKSISRESRSVIVQLPEVTVPGCAQAHALGRSSVVFQPTHLVVPRHIAPHFDIVDFKIGKNSQFMGQSGNVPASCLAGDLEAFSLGADNPSEFLKKVDLDVPLPLRLDVATPEHDLRVLALNRTPCALIFQCVLYGTLVE